MVTVAQDRNPERAGKVLGLDRSAVGKHVGIVETEVGAPLFNAMVAGGYGWQIMKANRISEAKNLAQFDTLQAYYSIAGRDLEREIVPLLEDQHTGLLV